MQGCGNYYNVNQSQLFSFLPLTAFCTCLEGQVLVGSKITPFQNFPPTKLMELFFPSHLFLHNMQCPKAIPGLPVSSREGKKGVHSYLYQ